MESQASYWPWWLGALALSAVALGYWRVLKRPLGISSAWRNIIAWREELLARRSEALFEDPNVLEAALLAATVEEYGQERILPENPAGIECSHASDKCQNHGPADINHPKECNTDSFSQEAIPSRPPWGINIATLVGLFFGGFFAHFLETGNVYLYITLGKDFEQVICSGWIGSGILVFGGILVGVGTQMAGGCTSGHGLNGCARLQPGSLVSTASFFGSAVIVSILLSWRVS